MESKGRGGWRVEVGGRATHVSLGDNFQFSGFLPSFLPSFLPFFLPNVSTNPFSPIISQHACHSPQKTTSGLPRVKFPPKPLYTGQKSRLQGLEPDHLWSHLGSPTPHSMMLVPEFSHLWNGHNGSFLRFLGR